MRKNPKIIRIYWTPFYVPCGKYFELATLFGKKRMLNLISQAE